MKLGKLSEKEITALDAEMSRHCVCGQLDLWDKWATDKGDSPVLLEFPLGELMNPGIAGFLWAWKLQGKIQTHAIEPGDRFNAQGLEGKVRIRTTLTTALLVYRELPAHHCQITI